MWSRLSAHAARRSRLSATGPAVMPVTLASRRQVETGGLCEAGFRPIGYIADDGFAPDEPLRGSDLR